ncbi:MAG: hypothetical protein AB7S38_22650 [Vulcanimicrobiota bacterium]
MNRLLGPAVTESMKFFWALAGLLLLQLACYALLPRYSGMTSGTWRCQNNIYQISAAAEAYATDFGHYPTRISLLVPRYLKAIPTCPATAPTALRPVIIRGCCPPDWWQPPSLRQVPVGPGYGTYSATWLASGSDFSVGCGGNHHGNRTPHYASEQWR